MYILKSYDNFYEDISIEKCLSSEDTFKSCLSFLILLNVKNNLSMLLKNCFDGKEVASSIIIEVIRPVLNFLFFPYDKISQVQKSNFFKINIALKLI